MADIQTLSFTASGLTTVTTPYTSGDQCGAEMSAAASVATGRGGIILSATLFDLGKKLDTGDFEVWLFDRASSPAADNAAADWSDANILFRQGIITFRVADWRINASNSINEQQNLNIGYTTLALSLFANFVTRQANGVFATATGLTLVLQVTRPG